METDYIVDFSNGKDTESHIISYYDTNDYDDIESYALSYADDEASNFLSKRGYNITKITKLVD